MGGLLDGELIPGQLYLQFGHKENQMTWTPALYFFELGKSTELRIDTKRSFEGRLAEITFTWYDYADIFIVLMKD